MGTGAFTLFFRLGGGELVYTLSFITSSFIISVVAFFFIYLGEEEPFFSDTLTHAHTLSRIRLAIGSMGRYMEYGTWGLSLRCMGGKNGIFCVLSLTAFIHGRRAFLWAF